MAAFAALTPDRTHAVFAVGDATAEAARAAGFDRVQSAGGDLSRLAALLLAQGPGIGPLLVPGAREPAGDLSALIRDRLDARALPAYEPVGPGVGPTAPFPSSLCHSAPHPPSLSLADHLASPQLPVQLPRRRRPPALPNAGAFLVLTRKIILPGWGLPPRDIGEAPAALAAQLRRVMGPYSQRLASAPDGFLTNASMAAPAPTAPAAPPPAPPRPYTHPTLPPNIRANHPGVPRAPTKHT